MDGLAPSSAVGVEQIIPTAGYHDQIFPTHEQIVTLVTFGHIRYEPDYGPNARVYRPVRELVDGDTVRSWLG